MTLELTPPESLPAIFLSMLRGETGLVFEQTYAIDSIARKRNPGLRPRPGVSSEEKRQIRQDFPVNQERSGFHGRFVEAFMFILLQRYMPTGKKQAMLDCFPEKFSVCSFFRKTFIPQKFRCALSITAVLSLRQTGDPERGCSPPERDRASPPVRRQRNAGNDSLSQPRAEVGSGFHFEIFP